MVFMAGKLNIPTSIGPVLAARPIPNRWFDTTSPRILARFVDADNHIANRGIAIAFSPDQ